MRAEVALDLEALSIEDLPFLIRDVGRRKLSVDGLQLVACRGIERWWSVGPGGGVGERRETVLDRLPFLRDRHVCRRGHQPASDRGAGPRNVSRFARDQQVARVDEDVECRTMQLE